MLVFYAGIRSTSDNHLSVIALLSNSVRLPEVKSKCETLRKILVKKSIIEYENRDFTQKKALEILNLTERFYLFNAMNVGDVSIPFWTEKGLHIIIKLDENISAQNIDEVRENVRKQLTEDKVLETYKSWIKDLREKAYIH